MDGILYTVKEVAKILKMHPQSIRKYIKIGRMHAFRVGDSKKSAYRISSLELERLSVIGFEEQMNTIKEFYD